MKNLSKIKHNRFFFRFFVKLRSFQIILFSLPEKKKNMLYGDIHVSLLKKYFDFTLLHTHKEKKIYFFLILKLLFKFKKINFQNYSIEFINFVQPSNIFTFVDNNLNFYKLKKEFPSIKFISIQNAPRIEKNFVTNLKNLKSDYILTWGDLIQKKYEKIIKSKFITIGSLLNNHFKLKKFKKKKELLFISSGYPINQYMYMPVRKKILSSKFYNAEEILLPKILKYCKKNNLKLVIRGRCVSSDNKEFLFYNKILGNNFSFLPRKKDDDYSTYTISDRYKYIACIDTSFGIEAICRDKKVAIFDIRYKLTNNLSARILWPLNKNKINFNLVAKNFSYKEVDRVLSNLIKSNKVNNLNNKIMNELIIYDPGNKKFKNFLKKII